MANVNDTVRNYILAFPSLLHSRADVLNFILFVPGNGFRWVQGEAVYSWEDTVTPWTREQAEVKKEEYRVRLQDSPALLRIYLDSLEEANDRDQQIVDTVDERVTSLVLREDKLLPRHDEEWENEGLAAYVPEDITPDWAAALAEIRMVRANS